MKWILLSAFKLLTGAVMVIVGGIAIVILLASRLLMIVGGPVNIWNSTWNVPPVSEVTGYYDAENRARSGFRLRADGRLEMNSVPAFDDFGKSSSCNYRGTGRWSMYGGKGEVKVVMDISQPAPAQPGEPESCPSGSVGFFLLLGHSAPHHVWYNIGDPDNGMGVIYVQRKDR